MVGLAIAEVSVRVATFCKTTTVKTVVVVRDSLGHRRVQIFWRGGITSLAERQ